ncbi:uracil-DNA glycosylase [Sphingobacteriales bacterium CHB3]|nr:uracil-DNA glycosylase [Sphingobacteriales bacterium CHB3]
MSTALYRLQKDVIACRACPRLVRWRERVGREKVERFSDEEYWAKPIPSFGDPDARLLLVGLAPAAHGGNRTGRMFTGDSSGDTLYSALHRAGFASQPVSRHREDGLTLSDAFITAVARCAPPQNRPTPAEIAACRPFLVREWALLARVKVVVALGQIAFDHCLRLLREHGYEAEAKVKTEAEIEEIQTTDPGLRSPVAGLPKFGHGQSYRFSAANPGERKHLLASYHPSRQNTQTGRLNQAMLDEVFAKARLLLE